VQKHHWGVILAGGDGTRLRSLTRLVSGDNRPKQFCSLLGGRTLLAHTRNRVARSISHERTVFVLVASHEPFYADELKGVPSPQMVVQPSNRGTLPAILASLMHIVGVDPQAVVAFFPSDHYYSDEGNFRAGVELALGAAEADSQSVILMGAPATYAETGYGWIEAETAISPRSGHGLRRVKRFWEKPPLPVAEALLDRGCFWNTFVMVGQAQAFLNMIRSGAAELYRAFEPLHAWCGPDPGAEAVNAIYQGLKIADFSKLVLSAAPEKLGVFCLGDVGWSDLGDPERLMEVLSRTGEKNDRLASWHGDAINAASNRESDLIGYRVKSLRAAC
jgi:mannose-1-phosphate guanylyltransferase